MQPRRLADRYELEGLLGQGGMAEVWRARDLRMDRVVAVKILEPGLGADPAMTERFRREAHAVARIAHPNIVAAYDYGTDDGRAYLVMELVHGEPLSRLLADGPLPVPQVLDIAAQVCAALHAAHAADVVHRDVKPGNVVVTPDGAVKVLDFGIARLQNAGTQAGLTRTATVIGTTEYMAPEQASGAASEPRTDLYALGCLLYVMLTGEPPFRGDNPMGVLYQHLHAPPPSARDHRPDVPPALDALVTHLMAKDPGDRPGSAAEVANRLRELGGTTAVLPGAAAAATPAGGTAPFGAPAPLGRHREMAPGRASVPFGEPAGSGTRVMPHPEPEDREYPRWLVPLAAGAVGVILLVFLLVALIPSDQQSDKPGAAPPASPPATSQGPQSPPTSEPKPRTPKQRLAEVRNLLNELAGAGAVEAEGRDKIDEELDKIEEELDKGEDRKAAKHVNELQAKLYELQRERRITSDAREQLSRALDELADVLPEGGARPGDDRRGKGPGKGKKD